MKQEKTVTTNIKGIERNANDINIGDGSCDEIINMRFRDGAWRPVGNKNIHLDLSDVVGIENITDLYRHEALPDNFFVGKLNDSIILLNNIPYISPATEDIDAIQASSQFNLSVYIDGDWTISDDVAWIALDKATGNGQETVVVTVNASDTVDRTGTITATNGTTILTCTVNQEGIALSITDPSSPISTDEETKEIELTIATLPIGSEFTSTEQPASDVVASLSDDYDTRKVTVGIAANGTTSPRSGVVRVSHDDFPTVYEDITINQDAALLSIVSVPANFEWTYDE